MVMAIIAMLAALLLPAVGRGKLHAQRVSCASNLRQVGLAFQSFLHDHGGKFPMQVSARDGGMREALTIPCDAGCSNAYRVLQVLSNELVHPKLLFCPTEVLRSSATNFAQVCLERAGSHISYAGNLKLLPADAGKPTALLAADDNLRPVRWPCFEDEATTFSPPDRLEWTGRRHQFKGNVLFADGHVEFLSNGSPLVTAMSQWQSAAELARSSFAKTANEPGHTRGGEPEPAQAGGTTNADMSSPAKTNILFPSSSSPVQRPAVNARSYLSSANAQACAEPVSFTPAAPEVATNVPAHAPAAVPTAEVALGTFDARVVEWGTTAFWWLYLLWWLLLLLYLAYTLWRSVNARRQHRAL
jgi:prepilin-type processing-associated H-X9-DG protein